MANYSSPKMSKRKTVAVTDFMAMKQQLSAVKEHKFGAESFEGAMRQLLSVRDPNEYAEKSEIIMKFFSFQADLVENEKTETFKKLMQLGFAGSVLTQRIFAKVMCDLITKSNFSSMLFEMDAQGSAGPDLLRRLLWCSGFEDHETRTLANGALTSLTSNLESMYSLFIFV
jgi:hypothetical protein